MRRLALAISLASALAACNAPSVPIPPPEPTDVTFALDGDLDTARFSHEPREQYADAVVYVFNRDKGMGVIDTARADGSVGPTDVFPAQEGDDIIITFEANGESNGICLEIANGQSGPQYRCNR